MQPRPYQLRRGRHSAVSPPEPARLLHLERQALPGQTAVGGRTPSPPTEQDALEFVLTEQSCPLPGWFAELQFPHPSAEWRQAVVLSPRLRAQYPDWLWQSQQRFDTEQDRFEKAGRPCGQVRFHVPGVR